MNLSDLTRRIRNAETPRDAEFMLREAIEKLIGKMAEVTNYDLTKSAHKYLDEKNIWQNELRHELLASINPKKENDL